LLEKRVTKNVDPLSIVQSRFVYLVIVIERKLYVFRFFLSFSILFAQFVIIWSDQNRRREEKDDNDAETKEIE